MTAHDEDQAQAIRRLAGGIAHDFNNLLVVISGLSELALDRLSSGAVPGKELERIQRAAKRARELTRALLAVACKQALQPREVDLNQALVAAQERLREIVGEQIELQVAPGVDVPAVFVDPEQLERIFSNLAMTALHRMPEGGRCRFETRAVTAGEADAPPNATARPTRYALLAAHDTGAGLSCAARTRIFEPYYSLSEGPGFGLALAAVEGIVAQSGGRVRVCSEDRCGGASFEVLLPAAACARPGVERPR